MSARRRRHVYAEAVGNPGHTAVSRLRGVQDHEAKDRTDVVPSGETLLRDIVVA